MGDIFLMSQLAHRLYCVQTSGRKAATKRLNDLEDVPFGLYCALDHLAKTAEGILAGTSGTGKVRWKLDLMIDSCASTLNDLDMKTKKYRDIDATADVHDTSMSSDME